MQADVDIANPFSEIDTSVSDLDRDIGRTGSVGGSRSRARPKDGRGSMIRINLIARPERAKSQAAIGCTGAGPARRGDVVITLAGCWWYSASLDEEIKRQQTEKLDKEKQVVQLKEQVKQVSDFESRKKVLEDKNRIIDQLEKSRVGPVEGAGQCQPKLGAVESLAGER